MEYTVSAIVPAYNEEKKIGHVLQVLAKCPSIAEVICVDDGSTDKTSLIAKSVKGVQNLQLNKNYGKAYAVAKGVEQATSDIVLFVDADIQGLTNGVINQLIEPLKSGKYDVVIGYRCSKMEATIGVPLSGERAYFRKDLIPHLCRFEKKGYGLELYLNYHFKHTRQKVFRMKGVYSYPKHAKYPYATATKLYLAETYQLVWEAIRQRNFLNYVINSYVRYVYFREQRVEDYFQYKNILRLIE